MRKRLPVWLSIVSLCAALVLPALALEQGVQAAPGDHGRPDVQPAVHQDVSPPLRDQPSTQPRTDAPREKPLRLLPSGGNNGGPDGALQTTTGTAVGTTAGLGFDGLGACAGNTTCYDPPDTNGAVGATQYVQWVNAAFAVYDKARGTIAAGFPKTGNTLWTGFGGGCEVNNDGDPIAQYDKAAGRWVLTQFSITNPSTNGYLQCVAVSTTSDATGTYNRYAFSYGTTQFNDYPKLGVWPDGYYVTYNIFNNGSTFAGAKTCAFDRTAMLVGAAATQQCFQLSTSYGGLLPSDLDGATAPPAGSPNFLLNFGSNALNLWKFHVDWTTPANTTLTGPTSIPVAAFSAACNGGGNCIPQPGTSQKLDSLADRLMYRLAYRHFADGHESLVVNHSVTVAGSNRRNSYTGVRWYELRTPNSPTVYQQGTYAPDTTTSRWMGSIAMDKLGNMALGYSASSGSVYPSLRYTGRTAGDALGAMQAENTLLAGGGSQLPNLSRWGDYSSMTVDPVDDCTFWYTTEYLKSSGTFNWSTRIASFKFPTC